SGLISPRSRSSFTIPSRPYSAANDNGVRPYLSDESGLTSPRSRSNFTTPSCPYSVTRPSSVRPSAVDESSYDSVVRPYRSDESGLTSPLPSSSFTKSPFSDWTANDSRSEEHTSELQSPCNLV